MNRSTLIVDLAQLWLEVDLVQSFYFEPGRVLYRAAIAAAGAAPVITADPTQASLKTVKIPTLLDTDDDATAATKVTALIVMVLSALGKDTSGSSRGIALFHRLCRSVLPVVVGLSPARINQQAQRAKLARVLNLAAFYQMANAVVLHSYQDKRAAHQARLQFVEMGLALQAQYANSGDLTMYEQVSKLISLVGDAFRGFVDELKPVAYYNANNDLSVLAVAWNIYQRPAEWADDLLARNRQGADITLKYPLEYLVPDQRSSVYASA